MERGSQRAPRSGQKSQGELAPQGCGDAVDKVEVNAAGDVVVPEKELCSNPSKYVCDPKLNPAVAKELEAKEAFHSLSSSVFEHPEYKRFLHDNSLRDCYGAGPALRGKCHALIEKLEEEVIYPAKLKQKAKNIFGRAKAAMLSYLKGLHAKLKIPGRAQGKNMLVEMIRRVEEARVSFHYCSAKSNYNAWAVKKLPKRDAELKDVPALLFTGAIEINTVCLQGMVLQAEHIPETLFRVILHELAHFADPDSMKLKAGFATSPFQRELQCLSRSDTASVKPTDIACFQKCIDSKGPREMDCRVYLLNVEDEPYGMWARPDLPENEACQLDQYVEGFAEWLAQEAYAFEQHGELARLAADRSGIVMGSDGATAINVSQRFGRMRKTLESSAEDCRGLENELKNDSHLASKDIIDGIIFAHPEMKYALGCGPDYAPEARSTMMANDPVTRFAKPGVRAYCGPHLYLNFEDHP